VNALAGQAAQDVPPGAVVEVPRAQASHEALPASGWTVPAAHGAHVLGDAAPTAEETVPAGQGLQPSPATSAYVPAGHWAHDVGLPAVVPVPGPHAVHCARVAESVAALAVFWGQLKHSLALFP
jgi:hypothetical protein